MAANPGELTDEMAVGQWQRIAIETQLLVDRKDTLDGFAVNPYSELAADDIPSNPYQVSHCVQHFLNDGIDHLHAVNELILGDQPVIHAAADYTLIRGALELFGVAYWVLNTSDPRIRIQRALQCTAQNFIDQDSAIKDLGVPNYRPKAVNIAAVKEVAGVAGCSKTQVGGGHVITRVMDYAANETGIQPNPRIMWQLCSGFAHGRQWATLGMSELQISPVIGQGVSLVRATTDHKRLLCCGFPAWLLMREAVRLFEVRARAI
ncbi:hypothetical protein [Mycobacterium montefiorense]|nr:hypothetical protein [Mycobacterium montefiorense]MCV7426116.1 hypothetical protein [Mycobacterium montefiorense]